ncbi:MAG: pitrilysin family protein [Planctomycetota bacterium]
MDTLYSHTFPNGLTLVAERMTGVKSLAMTLLTPAGNARQAEDRQGVAPLLAEMIGRGAGGLSSRAFSERLDALGVHRSASSGSRHLRLGATMIGSHLDQALPLLLSQVLSPNLNGAELEPSRDLCLQEIDALDDEPQQRVMIELRRRHFPAPLGRPTVGVREHLKAVSLDDVQRHGGFLTPGGSILSFAGDLDFARLVDLVAGLTAEWSGAADPLVIADTRLGGVEHLEADTQQVHIALAYDALSDVDERSILERAAVSVLSGGMSSRLFTEVREKRGLCYSVYASYAGMKDRGAVMGYAGTTTPRAQETLDVFIAELKRMAEGVEADELSRSLLGMKARLVMQGESSGARASAIAADQYVHGRPRSLDELAARVDTVTLDAVNAFVAERSLDEMTIVTVGPESLRV